MPALEQLPHDQPVFDLTVDPRTNTETLSNRFTNAWLQWLFKLRTKANTPSHPVNIADYGAVSDGVTNDNAAILRAIAAGNRQLYFPPNTLWIPTANLVPGNVEYYGGDWETTIIKAADPTLQWITIGPRAALHSMAIWDRFGTSAAVMMASGAGTNGPRPFKHLANISNLGTISTHWAYMDSFTSTGIAGLDQQGVVVLGWGTGDCVFVGASDTSVGIRVTVNNTEPGESATGILIQNFGAGVGLIVRGEVGSTLAANTGHVTIVTAADGVSEAITPAVPTTTDWLYVSVTKLAGQVMSMYHAVSAFAGTGLVMNFGNSAGAFTGTFIDFLVNSVRKFSVDYTGRVNLVSGQITYPAAQNASADVNTFDDYKEGTWTPTVTFATVGDLAVVYSSRVGTYTKRGDRVTLTFDIITTTFTHTTAAGILKVTGLPYASITLTAARNFGALAYAGLTHVGYGQVAASIGSNLSEIDFLMSGSAAGVPLQATTVHAPTGGTVHLRGTIEYQTPT